MPKMSAVLGCKLPRYARAANPKAGFKPLLQKARLYRVAFELVIMTVLMQAIRCFASFAAQVATALERTRRKSRINPATSR